MLIDEDRIEMLREFGGSIIVVRPTVYEMIAAMERGLQDPLEVLEIPKN